MKVFGLNIPNRVSSVHPLELSKEAKQRLRMMAWHDEHERNASLTCRHFGVSRDTFYRWRRRFQESGPGGLEDGSHRPKTVRKPTWTKEFENAVLELRQLTPGWGKDKLVVLLREQGWECSTSMVGRILKQLREHGRLVEAPRADPWVVRRPFRRPYGVRKPKEYLVDGPGSIVQVDTSHVALYPGFRFKHFTACDVFTRWQVLEAHGRATAHAAAGFLDTIVDRMPFPVKAIQVDGGSEFMAEFEEACRLHGIRLFVLPPRSPKLNGHVERSNRTHKEEFYYRLTSATTLTQVSKLLRRWEDVHNTYRPHQALGQITPQLFLKRCA
jgi:transposase InsO family protein/transposase-like protein